MKTIGQLIACSPSLAEYVHTPSLHLGSPDIAKPAYALKGDGVVNLEDLTMESLRNRSGQAGDTTLGKQALRYLIIALKDEVIHLSAKLDQINNISKGV